MNVKDLQPSRPSRSELDRLSLEELQKLCVLAFWLGIGGDRAMEWGDTRESMELFLRGVPGDVVSRFKSFLEVEEEILVPEDHVQRVAKLPQVVRAKAELVAPEPFELESEEEALEQVIPADQSRLVLRWTKWTGTEGTPAST